MGIFHQQPSTTSGRTIATWQDWIIRNRDENLHAALPNGI
jgi:hypothetical protein